MTAMADYLTFILVFWIFGYIPMYAIMSWKSYYSEKQREKTLREAIRS